MSKATQPDFKKFMNRRLCIHLQSGRKISGTLRGYDLFLNLVIDDAQDVTAPVQRDPIGTIVVRGNGITSLEVIALDGDMIEDMEISTG